ncbi:MAG TPA: flavin reductase family protein [Candidatus Limnocylindrales bacterium]|nr:flavin reductase family protein [Candidatus Limnocylindrales bacterium]
MIAHRAADAGTDRYAIARAALAEIPLAVVLVGAADGDARSCATATAMYVSFSPPRIAIALHPGSRTCQLVESNGAFSVSVLHEGQLDLAARAGRSASGDDKFAALGLPIVEPPDGRGAPGLAGATAILWCTVGERLAIGDHTLFVGDVESYATDDEAVVPLLRHRRRYAAMGEVLSEPSPEGYPT